MLTAVQEDYIEVIYRLEDASESKSVRVTDIASGLGTKLPTVTRTIRKLTELGLVKHSLRQEVTLSASGRRMASEIVHRHEDLVDLLVMLLGVDQKDAEQDVCQIEHGLSSETAQRLHEFLEHFKQLSPDMKRRMVGEGKGASRRPSAFLNLPGNKASGWRA